MCHLDKSLDHTAKSGGRGLLPWFYKSSYSSSRQLLLEDRDWMSCSIPRARRRPTQFLTLGERKRCFWMTQEAFHPLHGVLWQLGPTSTPPVSTLPAKVSERGLKAIIRPRSSCALVTGPLSGKLRSPDLSSPAEMPRCAVLGTSPANSLGHS